MGECRSRRGSAAPARDPCGKYHVPNVLLDLALRRIVECPAVDKSVRDSPWPCPSTDHSRRVPVSHVDMKVLVAWYLEKHDFAGVRHRPSRPEALDDRFQGFDPCRPSVADVNVPCGDRRRACAAAVLRDGIRRLLRTVFHAQLWNHVYSLRTLTTAVRRPRGSRHSLRVCVSRRHSAVSFGTTDGIPRFWDLMGEQRMWRMSRSSRAARRRAGRPIRAKPFVAASANRPVEVRVRNLVSRSVPRTASQLSGSRPNRHCACCAVSRRPGISRYSARTRRNRS